VNGVHRAIVALRSDSIFNVLKRNFPDYDQAFILVNSPYYGGTGGMFPTSSTVSSASEIILHEFAHSFAKVSDEYGGNCTYKSLIGPNITQAKTYDLIPWNNWIDKSTPIPTPANSQYQSITGLFIGAFYCDTGWSRPQYSCKMRSLGVPYCVVCNETIVERIHALVSPIDSYSPQNLSISVSDTLLGFKLNCVNPIPNTLEITWTIDSVFKSNIDSLTIDTKNLKDGLTKITATVNDTTQLSREMNHLTKSIHKKIVQWNIDKSSTGIGLSSSDISMNLNVYPNPFSTEINISLTGSDFKKFNVELSDINGNVVYRSGKLEDIYNIKINLDKNSISEGSYYLIIKNDDKFMIKELVKIK
jgi:hypothetical protein